MKERQIGYEVRTLDHMICRRVNIWQSKMNEAEEITRMQAWITGYLYDHREEAIFQRDIEATFHIARSTATGILQQLEKKEFIQRLPYPGDARLKKLVVTEKGKTYHLTIMHNFELLQLALKAGIPQEKLDVFFEVVDMIKSNLKEEDRND